jgi:hypothetical protein
LCPGRIYGGKRERNSADESRVHGAKNSALLERLTNG